MKKVFFLPFVLFASVTEPVRLEWLTGYRNDTIHSHGEDFDSIQFWSNDLALRGIHRDLLYNFRAGYSFASDWAIDGWGHLGYAVNLTPDRTYQAMVIPLIGYSGHYEKLEAFHQTWYGPYFGGAIRIKPGNRMIFEAGYAYNILNHSGHGQSGWLELAGMLNASWQGGLFFTIDYFYSNNLRWTPVAGFVTISRSL